MSVNEFLHSIRGLSKEEANHKILELCGVVDFFDDDEYDISDCEATRCSAKKGEYGDWQTSMDLATSVCTLLKQDGVIPEVVIEPTCGRGAFILAAINVFGESLKLVYGIEIYKPYIMDLKYKLLELGLQTPNRQKPEIRIFHSNIFDFHFNQIKARCGGRMLVLGNPPWVTNSKLGEINSDNLPLKTNFKKVKGVEAITGKGNFDIAEYITYQMFDNFGNMKTTLAFLLKTSVVKNIIHEQKRNRNKLGNCRQFNIDTKREFDVSVSACLFVTDMGCDNAPKQCAVYDFYTKNQLSVYGWVGDKFVSNVNDYISCKELDGVSPVTWWSGMKHDCSKVMELFYEGGKYYNGIGEEVAIENDLVYPLLKSSDVKDGKSITNRKYVIVTQRTTSDDTKSISVKQPLTYGYLLKHADLMDNRGSSIYKKRHRFCIFGIGPYSFEPYKIAIAGLYKSTRFSFVPPINGKSVMLDDTCYLLAFKKEKIARITVKILNSAPVQRFLQSTVFIDAKRTINKDLLMRIDLNKAANKCFEDGVIGKDEYEAYCDYLSCNTTYKQGRLLFDEV
jgi:hypothetical protein